MKKINATQLTNEEKARLLIGKDFWRVDTLEGKVPDFLMNDGPSGIRQPLLSTNADKDVRSSISYPSLQVLSQTWNEKLAYTMGKALANDAMELGTDIILAPGVNIKRLPHNGRNFEYLSEDPLVAGVFAKHYIEGIQDQNVGACLKHYAANNSETSRMYQSMEIDERTMREIYLPPHEIALTAKPWLVMTSYNLVNGVRMSEHQKLYKTLREEFKFDGVIVSDWNAVKDRTASLNATLDLEMPHNAEHFTAFTRDINAGKVNVHKLDASVDRVINLAHCARDTRSLREITMDINARYRVAEQIVEEGIVLLKNENEALPLTTKEKVLVTGAATDWYVFGGGSSEVVPREPFIKLFDAMQIEKLRVSLHKTVEFNRGAHTSLGDLKGALNQIITEEIDTAVVTVTQDNHAHSESYNRQDLKLSAEQVMLIREIAAVAPKTIVIIYAGAPIEMHEWIDEVDAVLYVGYVGERGNKVIAKTLSGAINPSGKLTETFPLLLEDVDAVHAYEDARVSIYEEQLNVGYRQFVTFGTPTLFPFGHGLSYSLFKYHDLKLSREGENVIATFSITNISKISGQEVAQVYVSELTPNVYRPLYELKGWAKVSLAAGETKEVSVTLDKRSFSYFSVAHDAWHVTPNSTFVVYIGQSAENIVLEAKLTY